MKNQELIIRRLDWLRDDMKHNYKKLSALGFNPKHLAELKGATKVVTTWIAGVKKGETK